MSSILFPEKGFLFKLETAKIIASQQNSTYSSQIIEKNSIKQGKVHWTGKDAKLQPNNLTHVRLSTSQSTISFNVK